MTWFVQAKCSKCGSHLNGFVPIEAGDTVICFTCDNPQEATLPIDPDVSVYAVPVTISLKAEVYVLGRSVVDARIEAQKLDLDDIFQGDDGSYNIDEEARANFIDADIKWVEPTSKEGEPSPLTEEQYPPTDHPDYNPADHDEVDEEVEAKVDPGRQEGLKS